MDTSVTLIGVLLLAVIAIPLYFVIRAQAINKGIIKEILKNYTEYNFAISDTQNKKKLSLDPEKKSFLLMDFNYEPTEVSFVNLETVERCNLALTHDFKDHSIVKIEFEFQQKNDQKKNLIPFYSIEKDQIGQIQLHEDHQLAKKWQQLITNSISV